MGHVIPHLQLAHRLATVHGFHVTFLVLSTAASAAQTQILRSFATATPHNLRIVHLPPVDISHLLTPHTEIQTRMSIIIRESLPDVESAIANLPGPTVLVVDFFATDAFALADNLRLSKYIFFTSLAAEVAFMMHLPALHRQIHTEFVQLTEPLRVPGCTPVPIEDLVDPVKDRNRDSYKWFLHHASRFPMADGILINTCEDLERKSILALRENPILLSIPTPRVYPVGPLINLDRQTWSHPELSTWLDAQPADSVLYVSFGSGGTMGAEQITELAHGLELSQQRFIWVVRRPFEANASGTYFDVGGEENEPRAYLPDGFVERVKGIGVVVTSWAPQVEILRHVSTGGFLTHCGWNSTLESIAHGVPMIAWPLYAEQKMNAALVVEELGVAVRASGASERGIVGREEVERVVRVVMEGEEGKGVRAKVKEIGRSVLRANEKGGSSFNSLCEVANEWKAQAAKFQ